MSDLGRDATSAPRSAAVASLAVVGTGLIGGSFAKAVRKQGLFDRIVGLDANPERAAEALRLGLVDEVAETVPAEAEAVLLAVPPAAVAPWVRSLSDHPGVVFDVGSVKGAVIESVRAFQPGLPSRYVPCHPIAGSERSGPQAADADIFVGRSVILTPEPETAPSAIEAAAGWWRAVGADVHLMAATRHDELLAVTSHLPHLLAFAYLEQVDAEHLTHVGAGFEDFTRIGAADPELWAGIFRLNRTPLLAALQVLKGSMDRLERALAHDQADDLNAMLATAAKRRPNRG